jgi:diguanylate cyclase (GGDEF)-like protein/PAS domain S-box-containing protein
MKNTFLSKVFGGIFGHFLVRNSAIQALSGVLLLLLMLPLFEHMVKKTKIEQGSTVTNTTLAATYLALQENDLMTVANYGMDVLKDTPNMLYIVYSKSTGEETIISDKEWLIANKTLPYHALTFSKEKSQLLDTNETKIPKTLNLTNIDNAFTYNKPIYFNGQYWGVLTIAFSQNVYASLLNKFYWAIGSFLLGSFLVGLFLFFISSRTIRAQMRAVEKTSKALSLGELSARAPEDSIGEIGILGKAINQMTVALEEKSTRLFQLAQVVEQTNDAFILFDSGFKVVFANDALKDITGFDKSEVENATITDFTNQLNINLLDIQNELVIMHENMRNNFTKDILLTRQDGHTINVEMRLESIIDEETENQSYLFVLSNITSRKDMEQALHQLAFYDKLTGLPNRRMFMDYLQNIIKQSERHDKCFALFFMDLDNFKNINDSMGHEAGDQLLIQISQKLKEIFRGVDLVTRLGGDEFTVIIEYIKAPGHIDIGNLAAKAVKQLSSQPVVLNGRALTISTSLGIAKYPENGLDSETLVKNADTAMYAAKKAGKNNYAFYTENMNIALRKYIEMETDLKEAIAAKDQIRLHYQPIVSLNTKEMMGVEVLARWKHPTKGEIPPSEFIALAEKTDLILTLGDSLLNQAFKQAKLWQQRGLQHYVSVNISVRQFDKDNFINVLTAFLIDYDINPSKIQLEFTEGIMLDSTDETILKFEKIKELGFRIAIDDFGTGYSSLSYIHKLPIDVIKIDQAFVSDIINNEKSQAILAAITTLSTALNIRTVAEGVEFPAHETLLMHSHCDYGQGYLYDASMHIEEFEEKYLPIVTDDEDITDAALLAETI